MSASDRRARDQDRDAAIELVETACAAGRIVLIDRNRRVEELRRAQTLDEIHMLTRDLRTPSYEPSRAPEPPLPEEPPAPAPTIRYGPPAGEAAVRTRKVPKALFLVPVVAALVVAVAIVGSLLVFADVSERAGEAPGLVEVAGSDVLSIEGYADLLAAVEEKSGGTKAFDAVLYPEYAVVSLPVDKHSGRYRSWYWDGSELDTWSQGTATGPRFDLATMDAAVIADLVDRVQGLVEDPTSWYVILRAADEAGAVLWAYASNEFSETAYLSARPDGKITYDSTQQ